MTEIKEPTYHTCKHGNMIWSDEDENDNREPCVRCTLDYCWDRIAALEQWQMEAVEYLKKDRGHISNIDKLIKQAV